MDSDRLVEGARELGVELSQTQVAQFARLAELLFEWNTRLNLTRVAPDDVVPLHFLDSLTAARAIGRGETRTLVDVGTGAGFPGLPLKIAFPSLRVTLLDATRKKLAFVEAACADLRLDGVRCVHARAEDAGRDPALRGRFDVVTARAVAPLSKLAGWTLPLARRGGVVVALKSAQAGAEIREAGEAVRAAGGAIESVTDLRLPTTEVDRKLVALRRR